MGRNEHPQPDSSKNRNEAVPTSTEAAAPPEWPRRPLEDGLALATERAPWQRGSRKSTMAAGRAGRAPWQRGEQEEHHGSGGAGRAPWQRGSTRNRKSTMACGGALATGRAPCHGPHGELLWRTTCGRFVAPISVTRLVAPPAPAEDCAARQRSGRFGRGRRRQAGSS